MIAELERVVLTTDLPEHNLRSGDLGTVVLVHGGGAGYEVEFVTLDGETVSVVTLGREQVRAVRHGEIAHVRAVLAA
jgi:hypothetical protein